MGVCCPFFNVPLGVLDLEYSGEKKDFFRGEQKPLELPISREFGPRALCVLQGRANWTAAADLGRETRGRRPPLSWQTSSTWDRGNMGAQPRRPGGLSSWFVLQESCSRSLAACPPFVGVGIFSFARYGSDFYSSRYEGRVSKLQKGSSSDYAVFDNYYTPQVTSVLLLRSCKVSCWKKKKKIQQEYFLKNKLRKV